LGWKNQRSNGLTEKRNSIMSPSPEDDLRRFNRWAAGYDQSILHRWYFGPIHSKMLDVLEQEMIGKPPADIVDVGCGTGRLLRAAAVRWPQARLFGVDPAERMISEARRLNPRATFIIAPAEAIPLGDESADLALSSLSFHHWADQAKGLQEIVRILRPGGRLCLADHTLRLASVVHEGAKSPRQIRTLIKGAGLAMVLRQRLWMRFAFIALAKK
jgi:ubiquinone/menaquinone biosynthesis C-methylase UbiE